MNQEMEKKLSSCLDYLEQGETVEAVLSRFSEDADVLRPFLEITTALSGLTAHPTVAVQQQAQTAFLSHAKALSREKSTSQPGFVWLRRLLLPVTAVVMLLFLFGATLVSVSATALPGDALYQVKRSVETYRLLLTNDPQTALRLLESYQQNRITEIEALLLANRDAEVEFEGEIETLAPTVWIISGLPVQINQATLLDELPEIGAIVRVNGRIHNGQLIADRIVIIKGNVAPEATPNPVDIPTEDPVEPVLSTSTPQPSATPTNVSSQTETPTMTPQATVTATEESVSPSATPTMVLASTTPPPPDNENENDDNSNDNGDDNSNDNGDDNSNDNGDDNSNDDGDDNSNDNGDDNSNDNGDDNSNDNGDDSSNDNGDDSSNDNSDDDSNDNGDDNSNDNRDDDSNENGDDDSNDNG